MSVWGGVNYSYPVVATTGGVMSVTRDGNGTIQRVAGSVTIPGANGGNATLTMNVARQISGAYTGPVYFSDPGANRRLSASQAATPLWVNQDTGEIYGNAVGTFSCGWFCIKTFTMTWRIIEP